MKYKFYLSTVENSDYEYDEWFEEREQEHTVNNYWGAEEWENL